MSNDFALYLSKQLLWHALIIASPVVFASMFVGLFISVFQVVTQIQDASLSFVPKVLVVVLVLMFAGGWMLHQLLSFTQSVYWNIPGMIKS